MDNTCFLCKCPLYEDKVRYIDEWCHTTCYDILVKEIHDHRVLIAKAYD